MKATEANFQTIIEGVKQFVVPLFQRTYCWNAGDITMLFQDICEIYNEGPDTTREHFIGAIVTMPGVTNPANVTSHIVIDGQQRMTTLLLFLAAIRSLAIEKNDQELADEIRAIYLTNQFKKGDDGRKLIPTQADRAAFFQAMDTGVVTAPGSSRITGAFSEARKLIADARDENDAPFDLVRLTRIITSSLALVSINLSSTDNPYVIFQSLNGKGEPLTQGDLIRNYFFMRLPADRHDEVYENVWLPMQEGLSQTGLLDEFLRHFLSKDGEDTFDKDIYKSLKKRADKHYQDAKQVEALLTQIARFAGHYQNILRPSSQSAVGRALGRLNRWNVTTAYPFLLNLYDDYADGRLSEDAFCQILAHIESFVVRRFFCLVPTNRLRRIFATAFAKTKPDSGLASDRVLTVPAYLKQQNWPSDADFVRQFGRYPLYARQGQQSGRCKMVLELLNNALGHKEGVVYDNLTVEHVMPQTLTDDWREMLGEEADDVHSTWRHTIGNLTLTGYNSTLSNDSYPQKQSIYAASNVSMNAYFGTITSWTAEAIQARALTLAQHALKIWERPL